MTLHSPRGNDLETTEWDVVVIGAGPGGSVTAREAARQGLRAVPFCSDEHHRSIDLAKDGTAGLSRRPTEDASPIEQRVKQCEFVVQSNVAIGLDTTDRFHRRFVVRAIEFAQRSIVGSASTRIEWPC